MKTSDKEQVSFLAEMALGRYKSLYQSAASKGNEWDAEIMAFEETMEWVEKELNRRWPQ